MNSLFNGFGDNQFTQFLKEFNEFKNAFNGDPKAEIERMLKSGEISQSQFNELAQMANQIIAMMPK